MQSAIATQLYPSNPASVAGFEEKLVSRPAPVVPPTLYMDGFNAYCEGQPLDAMLTPDQVTGWWAANKAQGAAEMPRNHKLDTAEYADDILDRDDWARGGWCRTGDITQLTDAEAKAAAECIANRMKLAAA